ncbi:MAG TPA: DUF4136 domain-containing protein [Candidatus Acidoferrum sp.]|nr:DUF4136 domain-containing protein [Candidatus Acidoferrum sp.]
MPFQKLAWAKVPFYAASALACVFLLAGCDEYVHITRDRDAHIARHATWAWRPAAEQRSRRGSRPVISRDVITRGETETVTPENNADNDMLRGRVKSAIEGDLNQKGLKEVDDPQAADLLVDFHIAVRRRNATVERVYPGGYPGLMCGPFGCYGGWGWGPGIVGYENIHFREGTIVVDAFQNPSNHVIYRAVGQKPVRRDTFSFSQDEVNRLVQKLLKDLKPSEK